MIRWLRPVLLMLAALPIVAVSPAAHDAQAVLPKDSPFTPAGNAAVAAPAAIETIEFAGVSSVGKKTDLIFYDKTAKKARWIAVGEAVDGIAVLNYDARLEQAVVRINGVQKTLPLRKATGPANAPAPTMPMPMPMPAPTPPMTVTQPAPSVTPLPAPAPGAYQPPVAAPTVSPPGAANTPQTPEAQARAETEARMLVSDLLEIGMAQRKAYEEAQRRAAEHGAQAPTSPQPGQPPAPKAPAK